MAAEEWVSQTLSFPWCLWALKPCNFLALFITVHSHKTQCLHSRIGCSLCLSVRAEHEPSMTLLARGRVRDSKHLILLLSLPASLSLSLLGQPRQEQLLLHLWAAWGRQGRASRGLLQLLHGLKERLRGYGGNQPGELLRQCQGRWAIATGVFSTTCSHDFSSLWSATLHSCLCDLCWKLDLSWNRKFKGARRSPSRWKII